jgi:hypothetical protein
VWRGEEEAFPGQNASRKGPDGAVRQVGVKASELQAGIKSKTRLKSALSKKVVLINNQCAFTVGSHPFHVSRA